jgi:23S rRNA (adenine2503-C2)-methyltransferase
MMKKAFFSLTPEQFEQDFTQQFGPTNSSFDRLMSKFYRGLWTAFPVTDPHFTPESLVFLRENYHHDLPKIEQVHESSDGTIKFLVRYNDGLTAEMVAMRFHKKYTLCLSSQVGCAMKCSFCYTGTQGLSRHLSSDEIVTQYLLGWHYLRNKNLSKLTANIVFMGQGEPLHNFDAVKQAIEVLTTVPGVKLGAKQITVSTVGFLPGLKRWAELPAVNLAISLHSAFDEERSKLIPVNMKWNLTELMETLKEFEWHERKRVNFEYLLIKGENDTENHAQQLDQYISQIPNLVNIIPFNPFPGSSFERPSDKDVELFKSYLVKRKVKAMVRKTRGDDILAACGQLISSNPITL